MESFTYLITFATYGSHLPGDNAIVDRTHNVPGTPYAEIYEGRLNRSKRLMTSPAHRLDENQREIVLAAIQEVCRFRGWMLMAAHVRTNHVHAVVESSVVPERVMATFKAYAGRALHASDPINLRHWARHGSTRYLRNHVAISAAISYVVDGQGQPMAVIGPPAP